MTLTYVRSIIGPHPFLGKCMRSRHSWVLRSARWKLRSKHVLPHSLFDCPFEDCHPLFSHIWNQRTQHLYILGNCTAGWSYSSYICKLLSPWWIPFRDDPLIYGKFVLRKLIAVFGPFDPSLKFCHRDRESLIMLTSISFSLDVLPPPHWQMLRLICTNLIRDLWYGLSYVVGHLLSPSKYWLSTYCFPLHSVQFGSDQQSLLMWHTTAHLLYYFNLLPALANVLFQSHLLSKTPYVRWVMTRRVLTAPATNSLSNRGFCPTLGF